MALAVASRRRIADTGLPLESALMTDHGGREIYLVTGEISPPREFTGTAEKGPISG